MNEEEEKLTPVRPIDPELWTMGDPRRMRIPHRSSRRLKFLGLTEKTSKMWTGPVASQILHGEEYYDLALGPPPPRVRRPPENEWATPFLGEGETTALKKVAKERKKKPYKGKTRGRPPKNQ